MIYRFNQEPDAPTAGKLLGFCGLNSIHEKLSAIKERFVRAHDWTTGAHLFPGAVAFGTLYGAGVGAAPTLVASTNHNFSSVSWSSTGNFVLTLSISIQAKTCILATTTAVLGGTIAHTTHTTSTGTNIDIQHTLLFSGADIDLDIGKNIYIVVFEVE